MKPARGQPAWQATPRHGGKGSALQAVVGNHLKAAGPAQVPVADRDGTTRWAAG